MKYLPLKKMNKSAKLGLVSSAAYIGLSFLPVLANNSPALTLENVQTFEQVKQLYQQTLTEYAKDKKISIKEVKNLYTIAEKGESLEDMAMVEAKKPFYDQVAKIRGQINILESEKKELLTPVEELKYGISCGKEELDNLNKDAEEEQLFINYNQEIKSIQEKVDSLLSIYYPGLIKEKGSNYNMQYSAQEKLVPHVRSAIRPLMRKANRIFLKIYHDERIHPLLGWDGEHLTLRDLATFREILNSPPEDVKYEPEDYGLLKEEKSRQIQQLEQKRLQKEKEIEPKLAELKGQMSTLEQELVNAQNRGVDLPAPFFERKLWNLKPYVEALEKKERFVKEYMDVSEYWSESLTLSLRFKNHYGQSFNQSEYDFREEVLGVENMLKREGFEVEVEYVKNPTKWKYPVWLTFPGSAAVAFLRNFLVSRYVTRREFDTFDVAEPLFIQTLGSLLFLDGIHPWIFPIRVFGMPFIVEPIRKLIGESTPLK